MPSGPARTTRGRGRPRPPAAVRVLLASLVLALAALGTAGAARADAAAPATYVALGDSYASGEGVPPYLPGTAGLLGSGCHRSAKAWPARLHRGGAAVGVPRRFVFAACSGADIPGLRRRVRGVPAQLARLDRDVRLVTVSIGGNDAGFRRVVGSCVVTAQCQALWARRNRAALAALRPALVRLYREIRRRTGPGARIVVASYPQFFPATTVGPCEGIAPRDVAWLHGEGRRLDRVIRAAVRASGARVELVDLSAAFRGHDVCRPTAARWFTGLELSRPSSSFHPNSAGHRRIAALVRAHLGGSSRSEASARHRG